MSQGLINGHGDRTGQIQATDRTAYRDSHGAIRIPLEQAIGQAARLAAEHKHVAVRVRNVGEQSRGLFAKEPESAPGKLFLQCVPVVHDAIRHVLPVVEARASQMFRVHLKPQRPHEPQMGAYGKARSADVSRILRDVRLMKDNMEDWRCTHTQVDSTDRMDRQADVPRQRAGLVR